jgi:cytochrome c
MILQVVKQTLLKIEKYLDWIKTKNKNMKKSILTLAVLLTVAIISSNCNGGKSNVVEQKNAPKESNLDGESLVQGSDCATCHKVDDMLTGPSYKKIADKYAGDATVISALATSIINGGKGKWGEIAMTAHPNITRQEAEAMVKYILSLKSN